MHSPNGATPFFIVSSGRSGTAMLHKALSAAAGVEMHHEYMVHIVQPLAVRRTMGLIDAAEAKRVLAQTHAAAVREEFTCRQPCRSVAPRSSRRGSAAIRARARRLSAACQESIRIRWPGTMRICQRICCCHLRLTTRSR